MQTQMHGRRRRRTDADSDARTCTQTQTNANLRACRAWAGESSRRVLPLNRRSRTFEMYYTMYVPSLLELPLWLRSTTLMLCKSESKLVPGLSHLVHTAKLLTHDLSTCTRANVTHVQNDFFYMYMEIHVLSTLAYEEKKGNPPNHDPDKQNIIIARDTWMLSLENWACTCVYT